VPQNFLHLFSLGFVLSPKSTRTQTQIKVGRGAAMTPGSAEGGISVNTHSHAPGGTDAQARRTSPPDGFLGATEDTALVERLRKRDEASFLEIVRRYHGSLVRLAQSFVNNKAAAEEVAQETWLGVLQGIDRFEGRSSLKTWIFQILVNRAKTRGQRESRSIPFSALWDPATDPGEPSVDPSRFHGPEDPEWPYGWVSQPKDWRGTPEKLLLSQELRGYLQQAIEVLPPSQREVITLRDVQGWTGEEVCNVLGITETNQRVLLHRARSKVRQDLEGYLEKDKGT
jgi:RNA polymerase sigma-70 factor (ECF subfamily)